MRWSNSPGAGQEVDKARAKTALRSLPGLLPPRLNVVVVAVIFVVVVSLSAQARSG